jgi:hypothetical protein
MSKDFSPEDFEPIYQQALVLTIAIQEHVESSLLTLIPDLTSIHTQLSSLITKASNPNSLLRKRCSDRHGDWLQLQYDLQNTLCEAQDLVDSLGKASSESELNIQGVGLEKVGEELSTHAFWLGEFISSLGLSKLGRKDPALGEIERILIDAVREERESLGAEKIAEMADVNRLGGWGKIRWLLKDSGVDRSEIERLDTRIKQLIYWVLRNEEEITMVNDLEGFGDGKEEHVSEGRGEHIEERGEETSDKNTRELNRGNEDCVNEVEEEEFQEVDVDGHEDQVQTEEGAREHTAQNNNNDTESIDSYIWV